MIRVPLALVVPLLVACQNRGVPPEPTPGRAPETPAATATAASTAGTDSDRKPKPANEQKKRTLAYQLEAVDKRIEATRRNAEKQVNSSLVWERVANEYLTRARLTGDYRDYKSAEEIIDKAFSIHDNGFGPFRARASLNYTLHRLDRIDADIERAVKSEDRTPASVSGALLFAGKLAFQRGDYPSAKKLYEGSIEADESASNLAALAEYEWKTGNFDRAEELYVKADGRYHNPLPEPHAWNHLMRGLMDLDRGRYDDALAHYREAETWLAGWYLVDEHVAEVLTLMGRAEESKPMYLDIIARTNNPEFMDAMAGVLLEEGKTAEAKEYVARALARYAELIAMYPEAAAGHALDHFLEFSDDVARTVEMAEKNHTLRPNVEAKILLARAYLKAERVKDAKNVIDAALKTPWSSADLHSVAADVFRAGGDASSAEEQVAKARAIDPHAGS